jgi:amino acid transporter
MESTAVPAPEAGVPRQASTGDKGLKSGAISFASSVVIGVASTAPGYSLAASLGFVVAAGVGLQSPAIFWVAFIPMLCIAFAYYYMNRADPDCGTSFTWATKAMGPSMGWLTGWAIIVADIIVMANLAQIAGLYTFLLVGWDSAADSTFAVTLVGIVWIAIMTWICYVGIELSAKTQRFLLGAEILTLGLFAVIALIRVYAGDFPNSIDPSLSWLNPFDVDSTALIDGVLVAVFIYWGWDSAVTVNEETEDPTEGPGRSAVVSTLILLGIYVIVSIAAQAVAGPEFLQHNRDDVLSSLGGTVFGSPLDKLLIIAVLTSAAASTQTTILPTARTSLSMGAARALPKIFARVHPRHQTPDFSTLLMGAFSILWYVGLTIVSEDILFDSITALGLMIAFYYGLTGFACAIYYRRELFSSAKAFFAAGVLPVLGGLMLAYIFFKSASDLAEPGRRDVLGIGPPLAIAIIFGILGIAFMILQRINSPEFFRRKPEVAPKGSLIKAPVPQASFATEGDAPGGG